METKKCSNIGCTNHIKRTNKYCSLKCRNIYVNKYLREYSKNRKGLGKSERIKQYNKDPKSCKYCNRVLEYSKRTNIYCNSSCSAAFNNGKRKYTWGDKIGSSIKKLWDEGHYDTTSRLNHLKQPKIFTSKSERKIVSTIKEMYPEDGWTSGGGLKYKNTLLSRDLYSDKLKICVEYDGIWHFVDIKGQLKQKQFKDQLLEEWCIENNYRLLRIDEEKFTSPEDLIYLIYNKNFNILKIGDRYKKEVPFPHH